MAIVVLSTSFGQAHAHTMDVVGDYKIEIGWDEEPPIQGIANVIQIVVSPATEEDKKAAEKMDAMMGSNDTIDKTDHMAGEEDHDHEEGGIPGLEDSLQLTVTLKEKTRTLSLMSTDVEGIYHAVYTPETAGFPVVHISGMILDTKVDLDMHPEEIESLSILAPYKQISYGIDPSDVQCKEGLELFMRTHEDSAICASDELGQRLMALGVVDYF